MTLPSGWQVIRQTRSEDTIYVVKDEKRTLFVVDFSVNANVRVPGAIERGIEINGASGAEFSHHGVPTDIVLRPRCGAARSIRFHVVSKEAEDRIPIQSAIKSVVCLTSPWPNWQGEELPGGQTRAVTPGRPFANGH